MKCPEPDCGRALSMRAVSFYALGESRDVASVRSRHEWTEVTINCSIGHEVVKSDSRAEALRLLLQASTS